MFVRNKIRLGLPILLPLALLLLMAGCSEQDEDKPAAVIRLLDVAEEAGSVSSYFHYRSETQRQVSKLKELHHLGAALGDSGHNYYLLRLPLSASRIRTSLGVTSDFAVRVGGEHLKVLEDQLELLSATKQSWSFWHPERLVSKRSMIEAEMELQAAFVFENSWVRFSLVCFKHFVEGNEPEIDVFVDGEKIGTAVIKKPGAVFSYEMPCKVDPGEHTIRFQKPGRAGKLFIHDLSVGPQRDTIVIALDKSVDPDSSIVTKRPSFDAFTERLLTFVEDNARWNKQESRPLDSPFHLITLKTESGIRKLTSRAVLIRSKEGFYSDVEIPSDARLVFNYALFNKFAESLDLTITAHGSEEVLFERRYVASDMLDQTWYQATEDLSMLAGKRVHIKFELTGLEGVENAGIIGEPGLRTGQYSNNKRSNVILVSLDTLRADRLGLYGYERETSPFMDSMAKSAVVFKSAFSQASWTLPSHISMLTGVYPHLINNINANFDYNVAFPEKIPSIASMLKEDGYYCVGFVEGNYVSSYYGFAGGYDFYNELNYADNFDKTLCGDNERLVKSEEVSTAADWITRHGSEGAFFMFVHTYAVHSPYAPPPRYDGLFGEIPGQDKGAAISHFHEVYKGGERQVNGETLGILNILYDRQVRWADDLVARLFASLEQTGLLENTLVIVTADHGEEFKDHGKLGHAKTVYNESVHVPIIMRFPHGEWGGSNVEQEVGVIDIAPTILDFVGMKSQPEFQGQSLLPHVNGSKGAELTRTVFSSNWNFHWAQISAVRGQLKYILGFGEFGRIIEEIYDLEADPGERNNLIASIREERAEEFEFLRSELLRFIAENAPGWNVLVYPESDEEQLQVSIGNLDPRPSSWFLESEMKEGANLVIANNVMEVQAAGKPILLMFDGEYDPSFEVDIRSSADRRQGEVTVGAPSLRTGSPPLELHLEDESATLRVSRALSEIAARYLALIWYTTLDIGAPGRDVEEREESEEMNQALRNLGYIH